MTSAAHEARKSARRAADDARREKQAKERKK